MTSDKTFKRPSPHTYAKTLSSSQRASLKGLAHSLKSVVQVGNNGLADTVITEIVSALKIHELIKIQVSGQNSAEEKSTEADEISAKLPPHAHFVSRIGRSVVLYIEMHPEEAKIRLKDLK